MKGNKLRRGRAVTALRLLAAFTLLPVKRTGKFSKRRTFPRTGNRLSVCCEWGGVDTISEGINERRVVATDQRC
jgi:hypothetical protein